MDNLGKQLSKVYFFGGYGTHFQDYRRLKAKLANLGFDLIDGDNAEYIADGIIFAHSYGVARLISRLTSEKQTDNNVILVSPCIDLPKFIPILLLKALTGYLYSKIYLSEFSNLIKTKRRFQKISISNGIFFHGPTLVIYTSKDSLVSLDTQQKVREYCNTNNLEEITLSEEHNLLDVNLDKIENILEKFLKYSFNLDNVVN